MLKTGEESGGKGLPSGMSRLAHLASIAAAFFCTAAFTATAQQQRFPQHLFFRVTLGPQFSSPVSGRLLLFVSPGHGDKAVDVDMMAPTRTYVAAKEVSFLAPGETVSVDADDIVFPEPLSNAAAGDYRNASGSRCWAYLQLLRALARRSGERCCRTTRLGSPATSAACVDPHDGRAGAS